MAMNRMGGSLMSARCSSPLPLLWLPPPRLVGIVRPPLPRVNPYRKFFSGPHLGLNLRATAPTTSRPGKRRQAGRIAGGSQPAQILGVLVTLPPSVVHDETRGLRPG